MISTSSFLKEVHRSDDGLPDRLIGTVANVDPLYVKLPGEGAAVDQEIACLQGYVPQIGDKVAMLRFGATWVILDRVDVGLTTSRVPPGTMVTQVRRSTNQSIPDNSTTAIAFDVADYLPFGGWTSGTQVRVPWDGWWTLYGHIRWAGNTSDRRGVGFLIDGIVYGWHVVAPPNNASRQMWQVTTDTKYVTVADTIELVVLQSSGAVGGLNCDAVNDRPKLMLVYAGPDITEDGDSPE